MSMSTESTDGRRRLRGEGRTMGDSENKVTGGPRWGRHLRECVILAMALQILMPLQVLAAGGAGSDDKAKEDKTEKAKVDDPEMLQELLLEVRELRARVSDLETKLAAAG